MYIKIYQKTTNKLRFSICVTLFLFTISCSQKAECDQLSKQFETFDKAIDKIKSTHFKIEESVNTSRSSWIKSVSFYSCDGITGYIILKTYNKEYIFSEVEYSIWCGFKDTDSFGKYYKKYIRGRYHFHLTK